MNNKIIIILSLFAFTMPLLFGQNAPLPDPGPDRIVNIGETVTLDGSESIDPDGDEIITYTWTAPSGITLSNPNSAITTFVAPSTPDTLTFSLSVEDSNGDSYEPYPSTDLFISEYCEGSSGNIYVELYNGTNDDIDLTGYELQIIQPVSDNTNPELELIWDNPPDLGKVFILAFNSDISQTDILPEDGIERVDVEPLLPGQTLMVIRRPNSDVGELVVGDEGVDYVFWENIKKITGDDPIALRNSGVIIDKVGDEGEDPGSGFHIAGTLSATKNYTLVRKATVVSGNINWDQSAGTNDEDSEWIVYPEDDFHNIFTHDCRSCDGEINVFVLAAPLAEATYLTTDLQLDESISGPSMASQVCSGSITLDGSLSVSYTGEIEYQWFEGQLGNGVYDEGEDFIDEGDGVYTDEDFVDEGDGEWNDGEDFIDALNGVYDDSEDFVDILNGVYDDGEDFVDALNGVYDDGEDFVDVLNGVYDGPEEFIDMNGNGTYDTEYCHSILGYIWVDLCPFYAEDDPDCSDEASYCVDDYGYIWGPEPFTDCNENGQWDQGEEFTDALNGEYDEGEEFTDALNDEYDEGEEFTDIGNGVYDDSYCEDFVDEFLNQESCELSGHIWIDTEESFTDTNQNFSRDYYCMDNQGHWNSSFNNSWSCENRGYTWTLESFVDIGNGVYDDGEDFVDALNGVYDDGEDFVDALNGVYDDGEDFVDVLNGVYDQDEIFVDILNGLYDKGEEFIDDNDNGFYDNGEYFIDCNGNGFYNSAEDFVDALNGVYDDDEDFVDALNGVYDDGEDFVDTLNGVYDEGEDFIDIGNGVYDEGEYFVDIGNGVWDAGEDYTDAFVSNKDLCEEENNIWVVREQYSFCDDIIDNLQWDDGEKRNIVPNIIDEISGNNAEEECIFSGGLWLEGGENDFMVTPEYNDDDVCILNSNELYKKRPSFNTMTQSFCDENGDGINSDNEDLDQYACSCDPDSGYEWIEGEVFSGDYSFILTVSDGLLDSAPDAVAINIADNLCSEPSANVIAIEYISFCDQNCNYLYDSDYGEGGEIKNEALCLEDEGIWRSNIPHQTNKSSGVLIYKEEIFEDAGNYIWDNEEDFKDIGNQFYDGPEPFDDLNGNCVWDSREPHQNDYDSTAEAISDCQNLNGDWMYLSTVLSGGFWGQFQNNTSPGFNSYYFCDLNGDSSWEPGETFYDCNATRSICEYDSDWEEGLGNGVYDYNAETTEEFIDIDGNCYWSEGEPYLDSGNGEYDLGETFTDIGNGIWDSTEAFIDINGNRTYDTGQRVLISGLNSRDLDPGDQIISYQWDEISGYLSSNDIEVVDSLSSTGGVISFLRPSFGNAETFIDQNGNGNWDRFEPFEDLNGNSLWDGEHGDVTFTLKVTDGFSTSPLVDTLVVRFRSPSAPDIPNLYARVEGDYIEGEETVGIALTWEVNSENSIDDLTGYYDFEGYRLYKSIDGGNTWGAESDKIYINGEFKGWKPFRQWDYTREKDLSHCIYSNDICSQDNRNIDVSGYDPYSYWINIGENTGITHYYFDDDVVNGMEYTYALTAYDTGVWTTFESDVTNQTEWYDSNPNHYTNIDGGGISSMESALVDLEQGKNISSVVPGYYATDIDFPTSSEVSQIIVSDNENQGNGYASYQITNLEELQDVKIKFEIEADPREGANFDSFEDLHTENSSLYAFYIGNNDLPIETVSHPYEGLLSSEIDSLLDLPGAYSEDNMIYHPIYEIEGHAIKFLDDDDGTFTSFDYYTDFISGTRMMFLNPLREYGWTKEKFINFSNLEDLILYDLTGSSDHLVPLMGTESSEELFDRLNYTMKFNYDNSTTTFDNRPPYTYRIEFSKDAQYMVAQVKQDGQPGQCEGSVNRTLLPFKVINTYTGLEVGLRHIDLGWHNGGLQGTVPYSAPALGCETESSISEPGNYTGDCDCIWSFYEDVVFIGDTVTTSSNKIPHAETTYSLELSGNYNYLRSVDQWTANSYDEGAKVRYGGMKWRSRTEEFTDCNTYAILDDNGNTINPIGSICDGDSDWENDLGNGVCDFNEDYIDDNYNGKWDSGQNTDPLCPPGPMFCDTDGDGISNGGSWKIIYPWEDLPMNSDGDGIYIDIEPWTWFADGDNWVADIGKLGAKSEVTDEMLAEITVSPNPYRGASGYPNNGMYFNHLPTDCEINIFTISGERVFRHQFNSQDGPNQGAQFYGSYEWDLNNQKGEPVGSGLYIYTVESLDYKHKHIAKFAIVR